MGHFQVSEKQHNNFWNLTEMFKSKEEEGSLVNLEIIDGLLPIFNKSISCLLVFWLESYI